MTGPLTDFIPIFYACIPDAPGCPPFEIAWSCLAYNLSEPAAVSCESRLIRPPAAWIPELGRDPSLLQAYGLALGDLTQFGTPARELAARMNEVLAEKELLSASVADDDRLRRLFEAANVEPKFALRKCNADELIAELARLRRLTAAAIARAKREAEVMCLTGPRAEAKARCLATHWAFVAGVN